MSGRYVIIHFETTKTERLRLCEVAIYQDTGIVWYMWDSFFVKVSEGKISGSYPDETCPVSA